MNESMNFYELTEAYRNLPELIGQVPEEELKQIMKNLDNNIIAKVSNIASLIDEMSISCKALKEFEKRTSDKRKSLESKIDYLKHYILDNMLAMGKDKIESPVLKVTIQKNNPKVDIIDALKIPEKYWRTKIEKSVNKVQIYADWKATGMEVEGSQIIQTKRVVIK